MKDFFKLKFHFSKHTEFIEDFFYLGRFVEELRENLIFPRSDFNEMSQLSLKDSCSTKSCIMCCIITFFFLIFMYLGLFLE